mmetsp:Transcript_37986/g.41994  ORF Transcript_37986/g.41994 Transcript_37986/m.41994 type:complete len:386 (+) Transcript_37986:242-1399(+)
MPRFSALVSLWCAILLITSILRSKYYRNRIYHRINLGCGLNIILLCVLKLWGSAAEPTNNNIWARGTIATCSISGFLHHIAIFIIPQYYCALSLLSYAAFRNKIRLSNFCRIEKWIHIGVYVFPLAAATYLLTLRAFNPTIHGCSLASIPVGCGDETTTDEELLPCDRGPNNISQLQWLFWGLPSLLFFSIPTVVLFLLCVEVKKNKGTTTKHIALHIASSLYETTCYIFAKKGLVFYAHHVVTICGCCTMLFFGKAAYWCCLLGLVEGTNIPLGIVLGGPFRTTSFKNTLLYKINGIVLWIMYVILRGPVIFALYFLQQDINEHGDTTAYLIKGNDRVNLIWNGYMWLVGLFLWGLSIVWFTQITNGMLKALGFKKSKTSKKVE